MPTFCPSAPSYRAPASWPEAAWPIEWFRDDVPVVPQHGPDVRTFLSSGTTGGPRSKSPFSKMGLELYQVGSLTAFDAMLRTAGIAGAPGVSLVPPPSEWSDSSLAQMVGWIAAKTPVTYTDIDRLRDVIGRLDPKVPVWLFGTAFHFVEVLDHATSAGMPLPCGSKVIETGGTKGKSRAVTRDELYTGLASLFGITPDDVISEYGMCELAAQAYDVADGGVRCLRFPAWVRCGVVTAPGVIEASGEGALVVFDPLRIDVPLPIRTEDLVSLDKDGSFRLLGRLGGAPLRGCSLRVEEAVATQARPPARTTTAIASDMMGPSDATSVLARIASVDAAVRSWASDEQTRRALTEEIGSLNAAQSALDDLVATLPPTMTAWLRAAHTAIGAHAPRRWLVILPDSHAFVGLPALTLGSIDGLNLQVRLPRTLAHPTSSLSVLIARLRAIHPELSTLAPTWRIGDTADRRNYDAVLCYGDDATVAHIAAASGRPTQGFGNKFGLTIVDADVDVAAAAKDALGLGQRGCMSTRTIIVTGVTAKMFAGLTERIAVAGGHFWSAALPPALRAALDVERCRFERLGARIIRPRDAHQPLAVAVHAPTITALPPLASLLAMRPHVIPIAGVEEDSNAFVKTATTWLNHHEIGTITTSSSLVPKLSLVVNSRLTPVSLRELGAAQRPPLDGLHEGRPLFVPSVL